MKLREKVYTKVINNGKVENIFTYYFLNFPIYKIYPENPDKKYWFESIFKKKKVDFNNGVGNFSDKPVFYLKINRNESFTLFCIQNWINIINEMNGDFYIICDNKKLEFNVLRNIIFPNRDIKMIKSRRKGILRKIVKTVANKWWYNPAYAHLTSFFHAKENNIRDFYTIDADDTFFLIPKDKCIEVLTEIKKYAKKENISAFSLDMHLSRTKGKHWSFGITYINDNVDWVKIFSENKNLDWSKNYPTLCNINLDWFFTWLRDYKMFKNEIFYVENMPFIHFGDCYLIPLMWGLYIWHKNKLEVLTAEIIYEDIKKSIIDIDKKAIKIDCDIPNPNEVSFVGLFNNFGVKKVAERT